MQGLYLITNDDPWVLLKQKLTLALQTIPIALVQYRRKQVAASARPQEVAELLSLCQQYHVP
ncbi:MAG: thiamine phosphate synthase, partial [Moraxellaceae bacterium]